MADTYKVLGQSAPAVTTETDLYTVPALTSAVVSTIIIANRSASNATFRISVSIGGGATANADYIAYDVPIQGNDIAALTIGVTLSASDKIRIYASTANLSFSAFGQERT